MQCVGTERTVRKEGANGGIHGNGDVRGVSNAVVVTEEEEEEKKEEEELKG